MKKQLTIVLLLVLGMIAVNAQIILYEAGFGEVTLTKDWDDVQYSNLVKTPIVVVVDLDKEIILITNTFKDEFVILGSIQEEDDDRNHIIWQCKDKNNVECIILLSYYKDGSGFGRYDSPYKTRFRIMYPNIWYGYYCIMKEKSNSKPKEPVVIT